MTWILNDLSIQNNFSTIDEFIEKFEAFLNCFASNPILKNSLLCSRQIGSVSVVNGMTFSEIVIKSVPRDLRSRILSWVNKHGPFWDDSRDTTTDDYLEYQGGEVTDKGLGECARRHAQRMDATSYSFTGQFDVTPIVIDRLTEDELVQVGVKNIWSLDKLKKDAVEIQPTPTSWKMLYDNLNIKYQRLRFSEQILEQLAPLPFTVTVCDRLDELCRVLEEYLNSRDADGRHTQTSEEIIQNHFHGDKAWFTDETESDKHKFKYELTFNNQRTSENELFTFHGKVKTPQVRMYFEWPIKPEQQEIHIVYVGPKITKK